tara:strand:+ start:797 stop:907 length:111 start_codon:yes stop_codon:yes gene_type:complete
MTLKSILIISSIIIIIYLIIARIDAKNNEEFEDREN